MALQTVIQFQEWRAGAVDRSIGCGWDMANTKVETLADDVGELSSNLVDALNVDISYHRQYGLILEDLVNLADIIYATVEKE
jgi:hypothetical protein